MSDKELCYETRTTCNLSYNIDHIYIKYLLFLSLEYTRVVGWDFDYNLDFQTVQSFQPENVESDYDAGASSQWDLILLLYFIRRITIEIAECV